MRLSIGTTLEIDAERAWQEVLSSRLLEFVCAPLQRFQPLEPNVFPARWSEGQFDVLVRLFGLVPIGRHSIVISFPSPGDHPQSSRQLRDNGHGQMARSWDHLITIGKLPGGRCTYTDDVVVEAGWLTPAVWLFAWLLYVHRQRRWRYLVSTGFDYDR